MREPGTKAFQNTKYSYKLERIVFRLPVDIIPDVMCARLCILPRAQHSHDLITHMCLCIRERERGTELILNDHSQTGLYPSDVSIENEHGQTDNQTTPFHLYTDNKCSRHCERPTHFPHIKLSLARRLHGPTSILSRHELMRVRLAARTRFSV